MGYYINKKILIIGGTGTIGQGLAKELLKQNPKVIRIFSRMNTNNLLWKMILKTKVSSDF